MKPTIFYLLAASLLAGSVFAQSPIPMQPPTNSAPATDFSKIFKSDKEKFSYAIGMNVASGLKRNLKNQDIEFDQEMLTKAFNDSLNGTNTLITEDQEREILTQFQKIMRAKADEKRKTQAAEQVAKGEKNKAEGVLFLAKNKNEPGVITTKSGLQYKVIVEGSGAPPTTNDEVSVNYRGTSLDGTEFDSSYKRNAPYTTRVQGSTIVGWTEVLQLMKPGSKYKVFIPSELAYGDKAAGPNIAPNATLIFDLELLNVKPASQAAMPPAVHSAPLTSDIIKVPSADEIKKGAKIETIKAEDLEKAKTNQ